MSTSPTAPELSAITVDPLTQTAWRALLAAAAWASANGDSAREPSAFGVGADGGLASVPLTSRHAWLRFTPAAGWSTTPFTPAAARALFDLYLPICGATARRPITIGHLGQSLDGYIATESGDSYYVTGPANVLHLHRLRAICDAVIVGAGTVARDDPQLTVRHAEGNHPARVILDPQRRVAPDRRVFRDSDAPTLLVCAEQPPAGAEPIGAEILPWPAPEGRLQLPTLLEQLHSRGWYAVLVEGGGETVSRFLERDLLDRLQIAIAPLVIGSGRPGLRLPPRAALGESLRPAHRVFTMGADVLFDCDLRARATEHAPALNRVL